jgi:hypothetical protein
MRFFDLNRAKMECGVCCINRSHEPSLAQRLCQLTRDQFDTFRVFDLEPQCRSHIQPVEHLRIFDMNERQQVQIIFIS